MLTLSACRLLPLTYLASGWSPHYRLFSVSLVHFSNTKVVTAMSDVAIDPDESGVPENQEHNTQAPAATYVPVYEAKLARIAEDLTEGKTPTASPRELLAWFSAYRRGVNVVARIRKELKDKSILTVPDFEYEFLDGLVTFALEPAAPDAGTEEEDTKPGETAELPTTPTEEESDTPTSTLITTDPTYRIGKLAAANRKPVSVTPDAEINKAVTLMMQNDYSQLPVIVGDRTVKGLVSWQSLGAHLHFDRTATKVGDCMSPCQVISSEMSIFDAVSEIVKYHVVLVRGKENQITGIVTTTDMSLQFHQLGEPFLLLGEIENHVRQLLDDCYTKEELETVRDPDDEGREINTVADLTFGEYLRLVENEERWAKLGLQLDRKVFIEKLDKVRTIRNDVMHFDPDGISEEDLETLRTFASFLQTLADVKTKPHG